VQPTKGGWIWAAGPVLQIPTATDDLLGEEKWSAGPSAVLLKQDGPWSHGALLNHVWSFAGENDRTDVNRTSPAVRVLHHQDLHQFRREQRIQL